MTTNPELKYCSSNFVTDFNKLKNDAKNYAADCAKEQIDASHLDKEISELAGKYKGHPGELLAVIIVEVLGSRRDQAYQDQLKTNADAVQIQGDVTKLTNDIQNTINSKATGNTNTINSKATGGKGVADVEAVAAETDEMQNVFGTNPVKGSGTSSWAGFISNGGTYTENGQKFEIAGAIGSNASSFLDENFKSMRDDIDWTSDPEASTYNNPTSNYHFLVDGNADKSGEKHLRTFGQMFDNLASQKDTTDAAGANKIILDSYNQNISTTQSLGTAANTKIGLITSSIKMNTSATADFAEDILTGNRTAINNQISRG